MSGSKSSPPSAVQDTAEEPLALTVHSMPRPKEALADEVRTRSGRWRMFAVLAICAAPVVASYVTYYFVRPESRRSYGELIEPQRPIPAVNATTQDGRTISLDTLKDQWLLISVAGGACDATCERHLYLQRQLREGLGKEKDRVDWVWLIPDQVPVREALRPGLAQAKVLRVDARALADWLVPSAGHALSEHLYLVDPMGHWMMRFPAGLDIAQAARVRRDLERLLRASAGWDQPGRPEGAR